MDEYRPASLPEIDSIDIVDLTAATANRAGDYVAIVGAAPGVRVDGAAAREIAALWRGLPASEEMRCHVPPFGFRFWAAGRVVAEASVCWQCNNAFGRAGEDAIHFEFDGAGLAAQELLAAARRVTGVGVEGQW